MPLRILLATLLAALLLAPTAAAFPVPTVGQPCGTPPPPGPVGDACAFLGGADALLADVHDLAHEWLDALP